jgi:peptidoglycan/xylan/chitin deacetylase (PgdA/CDA1 family)
VHDVVRCVLRGRAGDRSRPGNELILANNLILTIDDCSIESNVRTIFYMLQDADVRATFFPNTYYIYPQNWQLWRDIRAAGFEIGYHTREHYASLTIEELNGDFDLFTAEMREILGDPSFTIRYVRPPKGVWDAAWMAWAHSRNLITVKWNATSPAANLTLIDGIVRHPRGGTILLMHTGLADVAWLRQNLGGFQALRRADGSPYRMTTLSEALSDG